MTITLGTQQYDLTKGTDCSIGIVPDSTQNANAYYAPMPYTQAFEMKGFVGLIRKGSPVNYRHLFISPHGNGTHTECASHIYDTELSVHQCINTNFSIAYLCTCYPTKQSNGDEIVLFSTLEEEIKNAKHLNATSFIIRTLPNHADKKSRNYSGNNPPYVEQKIAAMLNQFNFMHLLVDLPSLDKEQDEGELASHKAFWGVPLQDTRKMATITELIYVPNELKDGLYALSIAVPAILHDALPSRIMLYPIFL